MSTVHLKPSLLTAKQLEKLTILTDCVLSIVGKQ